MLKWMENASHGGAKALRVAWRHCHRAAKQAAGGAESDKAQQQEDEEEDLLHDLPVEAILGWALGPGLQLVLQRSGMSASEKRAVASWKNPAMRTALQHCVGAVTALLGGAHDAPWTHRVLLALARRPRFWLLVCDRPRDLKRVVAPLLRCWLSENHRGARAGAFAVLSRALPMLPHPHGMRVVHMAGLTLTRSVRAVSAHTVAHFAWLSTSLAEVWTRPLSGSWGTNSPITRRSSNRRCRLQLCTRSCFASFVSTHCISGTVCSVRLLLNCVVRCLSLFFSNFPRRSSLFFLSIYPTHL
jgi:hypothetical protein